MPNISRKSDKKIAIENIMKEERWTPPLTFWKIKNICQETVIFD